MSPNPTFLVEPTLGRLARWLRLLGWFARVVEPLPALAPVGSHILTRRRALAGRPGLVLVEPDRLEDQLPWLLKRLGLEPDPERVFTICLDCNREVEPLAREEAMGLVPEHVLHTAERFTRCPNCGKVFWPGSHGQRAQALLGRMLVQETETP